MNEAELTELRDASEQRCNKLFNHMKETETELERCRGDFRTYNILIAKLQEHIQPNTPEAEIVKQPGEVKTPSREPKKVKAS